MLDPLLRSLLDRHERSKLFAPGETLLVGCSGGADSLSLAHALHALASRLDLKVVSAYVHHGLRREADEEADLLAMGMATWGLPHHSLRIGALDPALSPEEALREARYQALNRLALEIKASALALGHHADDQLETVLWRLSKGSGMGGLRGMPMQRSQEFGPRLIRPWLETPRSELESYLTRQGIRWFDDLSNQDETIPRNRIRHRILPVLKELNPSVHRTFSANQLVLGDEDDFMQAQARAAFAALNPLCAPGLLGWNHSGFLALPPALQRRILGIAYRQLKGSVRGLSVQFIEHARETLQLEGRLHDLGQDLRAMAHHGLAAVFLQMTPHPPVPAELGRTAAPWGTKLVALESIDWTHEEGITFDADQLPDALVWREARPSHDSFTPWGHAHAHSLDRFLAKAKVPEPLRERLPVLASLNEVLWIAGIRRGANAPVLPATRRVVRALQDRQAWFDNAWSAPYHDDRRRSPYPGGSTHFE